VSPPPQPSPLGGREKGGVSPHPNPPPWGRGKKSASSKRAWFIVSRETINYARLHFNPFSVYHVIS